MISFKSCGPIPHNLSDETSDGSPTLKRSGLSTSRTVSSSLRFLSPTRGTEGVVKTIEEDRDERWSLP